VARGRIELPTGGILILVCSHRGAFPRWDAGSVWAETLQSAKTLTALLLDTMMPGTKGRDRLGREAVLNAPGIAGMPDRAQRAAGKREISSEPGCGTAVSVSLLIGIGPLGEAEAATRDSAVAGTPLQDFQ